MKRKFVRDDIQGLRAVAVLGVVIFHAGLPLPGGFVGVDVFFVISGFVITAMLKRQIGRGSTIDLTKFYVRRFLRLAPALALVVVFTMVVSLFVLSPLLGVQATAATTGIGALLLGANYVISSTTGGYFDAPAAVNPLLNTWSLSVEEQFYVIFPVLLVFGWLAARKYRSMRFSTYFIVGLIIISSLMVTLVGSSWASSVQGNSFLLGFYSPLSRAWEFGLGALLSLLMSRLRFRQRFSSEGLYLAGFGLIAASFLLIRSTTLWPSLWTLVPVLGTMLVLLAGAKGVGISGKLLTSRPMVAIGNWSYALYLWHWPLIVFASLLWPGNGWAIAFAALSSFVPAAISYYLLEQRIRYLQPRLKTVVVSLVMFLLVPLSVCFGLLFFTTHSLGSSNIADFNAAISKGHIGSANGCDTGLAFSAVTAGQCTWNAAATGEPVYLVGDSNADQFSEGLVAAGRDSNRPVIVSTTNSCPFVKLTFIWVPKGGEWNQWCGEYVASELEFLQSAPGGLVVISNLDRYYGANEPEFEIGANSLDVSTDTLRKLNSLETGLAETVEILKSAGHKVVLVQTVPRWVGTHSWDPYSCPTFAVLASSCRETMTISEVSDIQWEVREVLDRVAASSGATVFDSWQELCPKAECSTNDGAKWKYRDANHITAEESLRFRDSWFRLLTQVS